MSQTANPTQTGRTAANVALLAPVPHVHLLDGKIVAEIQGRVAFGSRAWEVFRKLDTLRYGQPVDVYIYASHDGGHRDFEVSWHGRYMGFVESDNGAHPAGMRYRPPSTGAHPADNEGHWAVFWEVEDLRELPAGQRVSISGLTGYEKKKPYGHAFPPEGPQLIEHP
jgi:hypothetical protein